MIKSFPKIFAVGTKYILDIFDSEVEITEKIDGSQFCFGKLNNELFCRSKGCQLILDNPDKMFKKAVDYVLSIKDNIPNDTIFYGEYLQKPKHNTLSYSRVPKNNIILFGVSDKTESFKIDIRHYAESLNLESVPIIFKGKIDNPEQLLKMLETESILGGVNIEGVVVKNYSKTVLIGGQIMPLMSGKFVSDSFKEKHSVDWKERGTLNKWQVYKDSFATEARWLKAVQYLRDSGNICYEPKDIGNIIKRVQEDIVEEEKENIKDFLWKECKDELLGRAKKGIPEWYKEYLLKESFEL